MSDADTHYLRHRLRYAWADNVADYNAQFTADLETAADEIERLQRENRVLQLKAGCSLANNLCPDHRDKQAGKSCLACEIERQQRELDRVMRARPDDRGAVKGGWSQA